MTLAPVHQSICTTCRLRTLVAAKQYARARTPTSRDWTRLRQPTFARYLHASRVSLQQQQKSNRQEEEFASSSSIKQSTEQPQAVDKRVQAEQIARQAQEDFELDDIETLATEDAEPSRPAGTRNASPEHVARAARQRFGDALPENLLNDEQYTAYERLYGPPVGNTEDELVDFEENELEGELDETDNVGTGILRENEDGVLEEVEYLEEEEMFDGEHEYELVEENADEAELDADTTAAGLDAQTLNDLAALRLSPEQELLEDSEEQIAEPYDHTRAHPLTVVNRFGTPSSTVQLPASSFVDPVTRLVSGVPNKHISEVAHRIFGGVGLPYSTSTPQRAVKMPQKAIPLNPGQGRMSDMDADIFTTTLMPGIYASVFSVLVETRKRLGSSWLEGLLTKEGGPRILDAGGAGVGVLAARDVLQAEWERMHDTSEDEDPFMAIAEAGGKTGGESIPAPVGKATVLTSNEALRFRSSKLLDNTTFLPRLPDYMHASDESARERGKYDIIIAPHTLWPLKEDHIRKQHVKNLWSLLSTDGGVLVLLEKGVPRGFEMVAAARELLLNSRISSPGNEAMSEDVEEPGEGTVWGKQPKDKGMIVAPCTNHLGCPMYVNRGISKGRKDFCHFKQRYIRPPFLQKILGAKHRNHEDVEFSYVSVMRGRDLRDRDEENIIQGEVATDRAFIGFENPQAVTEGQAHDEFDPTAPAVPDVEDVSAEEEPHSLSLPRVVLPPLKRQGHVIIDMCTPAGTLERWTVPRSFSKQAYRDARKSSWGDIWALGAKTRTPRNVRVGRGKEELGGVEKKKRNKAKNTVEVGYDSAGNIKEENIKVKTGGRMRQGKIKGIRDKRDKKADGRGRRKNLDKE